MAYKLTYFDLAARGEPVRLLFAVAGVKFEDNRIQFGDWPKLKAALGGIQLPILQVGDKQLTQSRAVYRFLGKKFNLAGENEWEAAQCDEVVDAAADVLNECVAILFKEKDPTRKKEMHNVFATQSLPAFLARTNKQQVDNGGTWLIGKNMTWADIVVAEYLRQMVEAAGDPNLLDKYPQVKKMKEAVFENKNIKAYYSSLNK